MNKKISKRGGGKSVLKKQKSIYNIPNFLTRIQNDLTYSLTYVEVLNNTLKEELDFVNSLIDENK